MNNQYAPNYKAVQIALSTNCNLLCPGCNRTHYDLDKYSLNPLVKKNQFLDKQIILDFIQNKASANLTQIEFAGLVDDPLTYPWLLELLADMLKIKPTLNITFHSNASLRTPAYFIQLAEILNQFEGHSVNFSIDGLEDTNHIYRVGTNWTKIMANAKAFIQAGGKATWQFIAFPWNKHQEEEVKKLANEMGFTTIIIRNNRDPDLDKMSSRADTSDKPWYTIKQQHTSTVGKTDYTSKEIFVEFSNQLERKNFKEPYNIDCIWHDDRKIYISYDGTVWPCCYIAFDSLRSPRFIELQKLKFAQYGENFNNLYHYSIDKIMIKEPFYSDMLNSIADDKKHGFNKLDSYFTCIKTCSKRGYELKPNHLQAHKIYNG
jgi:MoaA/NifB/PqqE/SkfB family radical SAM enzyme|tara:strand:+ start:2943 stop:4067 length:1125 start_codon:yes stop_codon:yes gene_type:complete